MNLSHEINIFLISMPRCTYSPNLALLGEKNLENNGFNGHVWIIEPQGLYSHVRHYVKNVYAKYYEVVLNSFYEQGL